MKPRGFTPLQLRQNRSLSDTQVDARARMLHHRTHREDMPQQRPPLAPDPRPSFATVVLFALSLMALGAAAVVLMWAW